MKDYYAAFVGKDRGIVWKDTEEDAIKAVRKFLKQVPANYELYRVDKDGNQIEKVEWRE